MRALTVNEIDCVSGGVENVQTMEEVVVTGKRLYDQRGASDVSHIPETIG